MEAFDTALLILRIVAGLTLAAHGLNKIFGGGKIPGTAGWFESIGFRHGTLQAWFAACTETGAGFLLAVGLLTSLASAGFVGVMLVAIVTVHWKNGFFILKEGIEYTLILVAIGLAIATLGPGQYSIDHAVDIADNLDGWTGFAIGVGGAAVAVAQLAIFWRPVKSSEI